MTPEGDVLKYKKYCIIHHCKKVASFNYHKEKKFLYCNEHKLDKMINIKKGHIECEKLHCLLCNQTVNKSHYFSKKHIDNFDKNITITTRNSIKKKFIDIIFNFCVID